MWGKDRILIQVCLIPKTTNFAKPSYATPQSWVSFGVTQRADSHVLIPETQPRKDYKQRSFLFSSSLSGSPFRHFSDIWRYRDVYDPTKMLMTWIYPVFNTKHIWIIRWLYKTQMVILFGKVISLAVYSRTPHLLALRSIVTLSTADTHHGNCPWWFLAELPGHIRTF